MVSREFKLNGRKFRSRKLTTIKQKLRVIMKCYTVIDFDIDDDEQTFSFKKTYRISGVRMFDPKTYNGRFEVEKINEEDIILKVIVGEKKENSGKESNK